MVKGPGCDHILEGEEDEEEGEGEEEEGEEEEEEDEEGVICNHQFGMGEALLRISMYIRLGRSIIWQL